MGSKVRVKSAPDKGGEEYGKYHRAGVEGTYGAPRSEDNYGKVGTSTVEKTVYPGERSSDGGGEDSLGETASSLYQNAVHNRGDKFGDKALTER